MSFLSICGACRFRRSAARSTKFWPPPPPEGEGDGGLFFVLVFLGAPRRFMLARPSRGRKERPCFQGPGATRARRREGGIGGGMRCLSSHIFLVVLCFGESAFLGGRGVGGCSLKERGRACEHDKKLAGREAAEGAAPRPPREEGAAAAAHQARGRGRSGAGGRAPWELLARATIRAWRAGEERDGARGGKEKDSASARGRVGRRRQALQGRDEGDGGALFFVCVGMAEGSGEEKGAKWGGQRAGGWGRARAREIMLKTMTRPRFGERGRRWKGGGRPQAEEKGGGGRVGAPSWARLAVWWEQFREGGRGGRRGGRRAEGRCAAGWQSKQGPRPLFFFPWLGPRRR